MTVRRLARRLILVALGLLLVNPINSLHADPPNTDWSMWGHDLSNTRYNAAETTITPANVSKLTLRWAFAFPDTMIASSQPTVIGDTVYIGSWAGYLYALDAKTGKQRWSFFTAITGKTGSVRVGVVVSHGLVLFGDQLGRFFAVYQENGALAWVKDIGGHPLAQITGSPVVYGDRVYVPVSSREENASSDPKYSCCTFRGSLIALNINDGSIAWQFYTVGEPQPLATQGQDGPQTGPSGVSIWSTPAIDPDAGLLYISTDNSYSPPISPYSDSLIALSLSDGTVRWSTQVDPNDWNNKGCNQSPRVNCDGTFGEDIGFGAAPMLYTAQTANGPEKFVAAQQKTGMYYALDAMTGKIIWKKSLGSTTSFAWGASYDGKRLLVANSTYLNPGDLYALDPATGKLLWHSGPQRCIPGFQQAAKDCWAGYMAAPITSPGLVWLGAMDGQMRAFSATTGKVLWKYDTARPISSVNRIKGNGGSIPPVNASIANGQVYVMSGYNPWAANILSGNVMFVFGLPSGDVKDF